MGLTITDDIHTRHRPYPRHRLACNAAGQARSGAWSAEITGVPDPT